MPFYALKTFCPHFFFNNYLYLRKTKLFVCALSVPDLEVFIILIACLFYIFILQGPRESKRHASLLQKEILQ